MTILLPCQLYSFYVCRYYRSQRQQQHSANPNNHLICVQVLYALDLVVTCTDPIVILTCMYVCVCVCVCVQVLYTLLVLANLVVMCTDPIVLLTQSPSQPPSTL